MPGKSYELNAIVAHVLPISPNMRVLRLKPDGWNFPEFEEGQFVALGLPPESSRCKESVEEAKLPKEGRLIRRVYSIASSSQMEYLEFYVALVHSGALTPRIFALEIGDKIWVGGKATGMFTIDEVDQDKHIVMIATGTGLAPYMSMLRSDAIKRQGHIIVIHGAANSWDLGYYSELILLESVANHFHYHPTITQPEREPVGWSGDERFIEAIWKDKTIEQKYGISLSPDNTHIFLCGNPNMISAMTEILEGDGYTEHSKKQTGQVHIEKF